MALPLRVAPSLLASDFTRLAEEMQRVEDAGADWHHVDVMDGHFVPNLTLGPPVIAKLRQVSTLPLDVHLMIEQPAAWAKRYAEAGADLLSFHYEAAQDDVEGSLQAFQNTGCKVGLVLNPDTPVEVLKPFWSQVDLILIMSVFAGFGGQKFIPEVLDKVRQLRDWGFEGDLEMDGGINEETAQLCRQAGANVLVAGTYVFGSPSAKKAIQSLRGLPAPA
ncbi:MAG: ribulose-phosphate 3-epimerase [Planctomycetota bacterium]|nr:MAG: ribulose-phosphate 3-epimerase [Planctomycetota bacterium]